MAFIYKCKVKVLLNTAKSMLFIVRYMQGGSIPISHGLCLVYST